LNTPVIKHNTNVIMLKENSYFIYTLCNRLHKPVKSLINTIYFNSYS